MKRILFAIIMITTLSGCASFSNLFGESVKPIEVVAKPIEKTPLDIALPDPIKAQPIQWTVITPENAEEVFKKLQADGKNVVLFALTDDGYQQLAITISDLRNFMNTQRTIIIKYKEYYEPAKEAVKK